jgi:hypothetical protein
MMMSTGILRRSTVVAAVLIGLLASRALAAQAGDPLPSWSDGKTNLAILGFVTTATRRGAPGFVPPAERIATFDNDGTLWAEPMRELLTYLRVNGFKTFIVSGGGIEFMRAWTERVYGIPPEQVVGSSIKTTYELRDGKPVLTRLPEMNFVDDKAGKPVAIQMHIGRRPVAAFGNSDGDLEMLQWTCLAPGPALLPGRAPHRRGARVGLRPLVVGGPARQGARRGADERLDRGRHEARLEGRVPLRAEVAPD